MPMPGLGVGPSRVSTILVYVALAVLICMAFWPVRAGQALCFDDGEFLTRNRLVRNPSLDSVWRFFSEVLQPSTVRGYYMPLPMVSLMLDYALGGRPEDLLVFHTTSLLLHVTNAILHCMLLHRLFGRLIPAALAAALFGLHPLAVEPVAWVGERKTLLASFFILSCMLAYVRSARGHAGRWLAAAWVLFLFALLSKPTALPLPILLLLLDVWPLQRWGRGTILRTVPFFLLAGFFALIFLLSHERTAGIESQGPSSLARVPLVMAYLLVFYLGKIWWPANLCPVYPLPQPIGPGHWPYLASLIICAALVCLVAASLRRTRALAIGSLMFFVAILPTLGLVKYSWVSASDKYVYLPAVGLLLVLTWALARAWQASGRGSMLAKVALGAVAAAALSAEAVATRRQLAHWRDSKALYEHTLSLAPDSAPAHNNMGNALVAEGRMDAAIQHFRLAVKHRADYHEAYFNLAAALGRLGRHAEALSELETARRLDPADAATEYQLGVTLRALGRHDEAGAHLQRALALRPDSADAHYQLGLVHLAQGRLQEAEELIAESLDLNPGHAEARNNYGSILMRTGRARQAIDQLREAVRLRPSYAMARFNLGSALVLLGRDRDAVGEFHEAIRLAPESPASFNALAWLRATHADSSLRDGREAVELAERAAGLAGNADPGILDTLAAALAETGRFEEAVATAEKAKRLAEAAGDAPLAREIERRCGMYRQGQAFRQSSQPDKEQSGGAAFVPARAGASPGHREGAG